MRTSDVDGVFPKLRRHALTEVGPQAVDTLGRLQSQGAVGGQPRLLKPIRHIAGKVFPHRTRHRIGSSRRTIKIAGVDPISFDRDRVAARLGIGISCHQGRVSTEVNIVHIAPLAEVIAVGRRRNVRRGRGRAGVRITTVIARIETGLTILDLIARRPTGGAHTRRTHQGDAFLVDLTIVTGVVEGRVEHDMHTLAVGRGHKTLKRTHRRRAVLRHCA